MLPFKWLFHFFSLLGCPANGLLDRSWGGEKKKNQQKALLLELADGLVLDSDNAFILLCQASSAAKNDQRGGKREGKIHISVTQLFQTFPEVWLQFLPKSCDFLKIKTQNKKSC